MNYILKLKILTLHVQQRRLLKGGTLEIKR